MKTYYNVVYNIWNLVNDSINTVTMCKVDNEMRTKVEMIIWDEAKELIWNQIAEDLANEP